MDMYQVMSDDPSSGFIPKTTNALTSILKLEQDFPGLEGGQQAIEDYLYERYRSQESSRWLKAYYVLKPLIPHGVGLKLRRLYSRAQKQMSFPSWPEESILVDSVDRYMKVVLETTGRPSLHRIAPWPDGKQAAFTITHDVEWDSGLRNAEALAEIEIQYGYRSSWNIVPERYPIDWSIIDRLRSKGFEIGVHGLHHDGTLFRSREDFDRNVVIVNRYIKEWSASGFRSESTLRNADWMWRLDALYDSSFPDTDPYEPKAGGCCSIWPYFFGNLIELPITLPQDHTLFDILRHTDISIWQEKATWIEKKGGCILIDIHPDYMKSADRLQLYDSFLSFMKSKSEIWHALPRDVAQWWKIRDRSSLRQNGPVWIVDGPASGRAGIIKTSLDNRSLRHQMI